MNSSIKYKLVILFFALGLSSYAQKDIITYGLQIKPLVPISFFTGESIKSDSLGFLENEVASKTGYSFGMVIRRGYTNTIAIEYGINYVRRNYSIRLRENDTEIDYADFGYVSYEIPVQVLLYAKLSDELYINGSGGFSINFFASGVESDGDNELIRHFSTKERYADLALLSNLGFEYRTKEKGYFYLGSSLHLPFNHVANTTVKYDDGVKNHTFKHELRGSYLTIDLRYFFPETTRVIKKKKKKKEDK